MIPGITLPSDYARLALKVAPYILLTIFFALWWHRGDVIKRKEAERAALVAIYEQTAAEAMASDLDHAANVAAAYNKAREEVSHDLEKERDAARADAARYAARLRNQAAEGGGGTAHLSAVAESPGVSAGSGEAAELDDAEACAEAVVKAEGWPAWWIKISEVSR